MSKLDNYFMKPQEVQGVGLVYPVKLYDYERFKELAMRYVVLDIKSLNNFQKQNKLGILPFDNLYDFLVERIKANEYNIAFINEQSKMLEGFTEEQVVKIMGENEDIKTYFSLVQNFVNVKGELCELICFTVKNNVCFDFNSNSFLITNEENELIGVINKDNFYTYREKIMEQNVLFEPRIAPNKRSQEMLDKKFKKKGNGAESDLEAIVALVSTAAHVDVSNYTYYRLMADFYSIIKQKEYDGFFVFKANGVTTKNGGDLKAPDLTEKLDILYNPFAFENVYKKHEETELDRQLSNR
ncbi:MULTISPECIES: hypothetical protein [unclassified Clostridium]|uniref:hypothetical protein n=1 Tax=unclassified Clostridium TaxID=2614128 RepID=UPI0025BF003A|nr:MULTISPECIES: hypothetical protein [unclassified Clostridium]